MQPSRSLHWVLAPSIALALWLSSCHEDEPEGYALASDRCGNQLCDEGRVFGGAIKTGGRTPQTGDAGEAPADGGAAAPQTVRGVVGVIQSADLQTVAALGSDQVRVSTLGPDGVVDTTRYQLGTGFELQASGFPALLSVQPLDDALGLMHTLQWLEEAQTSTQALVMDRTIVSDLADNLAVNPTWLDATRGHAFVHFVDAAGRPLPEVSVSAGDATVAYDIGVFYTDAEEKTAERGSVVLLNANAAAFPGRRQLVRVVFQGELMAFELPIASDAVTLATIEL